jgi:diguanylate cyclase (GGDEF)-like protein
MHLDAAVGNGSLHRIEAAIARGEPDIELQAPAGDGTDRWFLARASRREDAIEGSIQDITVRKQAERQLRNLVDHDPLTDLLNRRGLDASLKRLIDSVKAGGSGTIAYVDLDRFKLINDLYGHSTGDALLIQSARRLLSAVRSGDHVARLADGFMVLLPDCPEQAVPGLTERFRGSISDTPFEIEGKCLTITASVGVASIDRSMSAIDAIAAADRACAEAKARGRNCVFRLMEHDSQLKSHLEELRLVADLQQRVPTERYFLEFQPIVSLQSAMASLSYEALIRMRGDAGQVIPPGKFIGAAERNGLMAQIDRWVLRSTLEWLDDHPDHRDRLAFATINISGASLNDIRFVDDAFAMIAEHPLAMPKLCFEITESVALHDLGSTRRFVDRVRMYGSKLALDDFGAGYTSFNYLKEIPADFIKIDGSFVKEINRNPANYAITRMIVDLTHELGMRSIAEWAETPDTIASLIQLGVDYGQGFGLARPMAPRIVTAATSGGALVNDPLVLTLLHEGSAGAGIAAAAGRARRRQIAR